MSAFQNPGEVIRLIEASVNNVRVFVCFFFVSTCRIDVARFAWKSVSLVVLLSGSQNVDQNKLSAQNILVSRYKKRMGWTLEKLKIQNKLGGLFFLFSEKLSSGWKPTKLFRGKNVQFNRSYLYSHGQIAIFQPGASARLVLVPVQAAKNRFAFPGPELVQETRLITSPLYPEIIVNCVCVYKCCLESKHTFRLVKAFMLIAFCLYFH